MEREIQGARQKLGNAMREAHAHQQPDQVIGAVRELRSEVERLRAEIKELSQKVDKDKH